MTATGLAFLGVRYGEPPVGARRWLPPAPTQPTDNLIDATRFGPSPPQTPSPATPWHAAFTPASMSEDCLNLNVWTPAADGARRPVLVHVFGGGFETGGASEGLQDGASLSGQADAVVVRVNFRIGALGFLYFGDAFGKDYAQGNAGLIDLCVALEWVRENIAPLGGDPDNVTVFGLSSGAFMIASLFSLTRTRGLFAKAWMQSGSASRILTRAQAIATAQEFLSHTGLTNGDRERLAALDLEVILATQRKIAAVDLGDRNAPGGRTLGVVKDDASLTRHPMDVFGASERADVPIVLGFTRDESRLWFAAGVMREPHSMDDVLAEMARFSDPTHGDRLFQFYRRRYADASPLALREKFLSDAVYVVPALRTARAHAEAGAQAHLYRFDWTPPGAGAAYGASHGFDEPFVWNNADQKQFPLTAGDMAEAALGDEMSKALIDFARSGAPGEMTAGHLRVFGNPTTSSVTIDEKLIHAWEGVPRP